MGNVQLKNTQGEITSVPAEQAKDLLSTGYTLPNQADLDQSYNEEKYGGIGQTLGAAAEGVVRGVLPGGGAVLNALGDTPEGQAGRKAASPIVSGGSELGGLGLGLLAGTGEESLAADAAGGTGLFDTAKAAIAAPTKAISSLGHAVSDSAEASGLASKAISAGLGSAAEGAAYGLGQSVDESALGDPDAMGENLLHNIGYSALFAGGLGAALGKFTEKAPSVADSALQGVNDQLGVDAGAQAENAEKQTVFEHLRSENREAPAVKQAAEDLGLPVFPEQVSDSPTIKKYAEALQNRDDEIGIGENAKRQDAYQKAGDVVQGTLSNVEGGTARDTGDFLRTDLASVVKERAKPFEERYDNIEKFTGPIQVAPEQSIGLGDEIRKIVKTDYLPASGEQARFLEGIADHVDQVSSAAELAKIRTAVSAQTAGNYTLGHYAGEIAKIINSAQEKLGLAKIASMPEGAARDAAQAAYDDSRVIGKDYAAFKQDLNRVGRKFGASPKAGVKGVLAKITDDGKLSSEQIAKRFMSTGDTKALEFLQQYAPSSFQAVMDREKSRILEFASKSGHFNPNVAIKEIDKMSPELQGLVFKEGEVDKIRAAETYIKGAPKKYFTSGTANEARIHTHLEGMTAAGAALLTGHPLVAAGAIAKHMFGNKLTSIAMKEAIERLGPGSENKVGALAMLERLNGKVSMQINSKAKALFNLGDLGGATASGVIAKMVAKSDDEHDKTSKQIMEYSNNPEKMIDDLSQNTQPLYAFAPNTATSLSKSAASATNFLKSKLPNLPPAGPLGMKLRPSITQKAIFGNYMYNVENPTHTIDKLKEGTLVPQDIETLTNVYPKLYQQMKQSVYSSMVDHVDKNGVDNIPNKLKVGLSLFLGQDMDASLSPQSVAATQAVFNGASQQKDQQDQQQKTVRPSQKGLSALNKSQSILTNAQQTAQRGVES